MKATLACLACIFASSMSLLGTPDRTITVDEDFLGSNATSFAILRTETDNHSSYYRLQVTRYLDEYEKTPEQQPVASFLARRIKRTTLLDMDRLIDPDTGAKSENVRTRNDSTQLADLLTRYPERAYRWDGSRFAKLSSWKRDGRITSGQANFLSNYTSLPEEIFGKYEHRPEWKLEQATEDMNSLYLRVSTGLEGVEADDEGSRQSRWICIIPAKTRQVHDHLDLQPMYLCAGSFPKAEEAVKQAREMITKAREAKSALPSLEVWSVQYGSSPVCHTLVLRTSMEDIQPDAFKQLQLIFGASLSPISSGCFLERTHFKESP
ncbi:hypothetical protein [Prosthecobacter sp.]|uniref:hypothetical protein n=1 Tax=Prosthecobacter sp. TaxID=1965333 RepID=UPI0037852322